MTCASQDCSPGERGGDMIPLKKTIRRVRTRQIPAPSVKLMLRARLCKMTEPGATL